MLEEGIFEHLQHGLISKWNHMFLSCFVMVYTDKIKLIRGGFTNKEVF